MILVLTFIATQRTSIELIAVADPVEIALGQVVQGSEIVVTGNAMDRTYADLMKTPEEVLGEIHGIFQLPRSNVLRYHDDSGGGEMK